MCNRILLVDDDPLQCRMLSLALSKNGYEPAVSLTGQDALDYLEDHPVDLIILDYMMPGLNGLDVLERLRATPAYCATPVILLTGNAGALGDISRFNYAPVTVVSKPVTPSELTRHIRDFQTTH